MRFSEKWFNPLYFILNDIIKDDNVRMIFVYGGKSSTKTFTISQLLLKELVVKKCSSLAYRKESVTIQDTLKKSFIKALKTLYFQDIVDVFSWHLRHGSNEIHLRGLDSEEKAKGIESYKYVYLDELNHFTLDEFITFNVSLRGIKGQKIFASWNPVDENSWIKKDIIDKNEWIETKYKLPCEHSFVKISADGKIILIKTTYEDNYWIAGSPDGSYGYRDDNLIAEYNKLKELNYNRYRVEVLGEWGKVAKGGEYYNTFMPEKTVQKCEYNPNLPLHISFDFNYVPYNPAGVFQVEIKDNKYIVRMIHEQALTAPGNSVEHVCDALIKKYEGHKKGFILYGDATGKTGTISNKEQLSYIDTIKKKFRGQIFRFPLSNPLNNLRRDFMNKLLNGEIPQIEFLIDPSCRLTIDDFLYTKEDINGGKNKHVVKEGDRTFQKYGHFGDLSEYFLCEAFKSYFSKSNGKSISSGTLEKFNRINV